MIISRTLSLHMCSATLGIMLCGCYNQVLLNMESIADTTAGDIVALTKDGRRVSFSEGSYTITTDSTGRKMLEGSGRMQPRVSAPDEPFTGKIPIDEIESIHSSEKSALFYLSIVAGVAATAFVVLLIVVYGRMGKIG